ncbi:MAG: helix-turn-helix transcriptional regulator [Candidatus Eremiobacteraeota bacterium]|nr:helix-turn-helix transcriptional regulator [Candidatus Eremiobacteraeota bacterium]
MDDSNAAWDGQSGTGGGPAVGAALRRLAEERTLDAVKLSAAAGLSAGQLERVFAGSERLTVSQLARFAQALKLRAVEFLQQAGFLSLEVYALGLDPLYFLPQGQIRKDARIYMREINPRHAVPERDMLGRNPALKALSSDEVLDPLGRLEIELAYLLRAAVQNTGGRL